MRVTNETIDTQPGPEGGRRWVEAWTPTSRATIARIRVAREVIVGGVIDGAVVVDLQHVNEHSVLQHVFSGVDEF
jgi:hypothetical protein